MRASVPRGYCARRLRRGALTPAGRRGRGVRRRARPVPNGGGDMDELIRLVAQKAGISQEQARTAATTVVGFLKGRLPEPLAGQLDQYLGGAGAAGAPGAGGLGGLAQGLGSMFGGDKK